MRVKKRKLAALLAAVTVLTTVCSPTAYAKEPAWEDGSGQSYMSVSGGDESTGTAEPGYISVSGGNLQIPGTAVSGGDAGNVVYETDEPAPVSETESSLLVSLMELSDIMPVSDMGVVGILRDIPYPAELGGAYHSHLFTLNGSVAYCLEPQQSSPDSGAGGSLNTKYDANTTKALYYGYGGYSDALKTFLQEKGLEATDDRMYIYTHIAVSYYYNDQDAAIAFYGIPDYTNTPAWEWTVSVIPGLQNPVYSDGTGASVAPQNLYMGLRFGTYSYWTSIPGGGQPGESILDYSWYSNTGIRFYGDLYLQSNTKIDYMGAGKHGWENGQFCDNQWHNGETGYDDWHSVTMTGTGDPAYYLHVARTTAAGEAYRIMGDPDSPYVWRGGELARILGSTAEYGYALQYCEFSDSQDIGQIVRITLSGSSSGTSVNGKLTPLRLTLRKENTEGEPLEGATYSLYWDEACTQPMSKTATTDASGEAAFSWDVAGELSMLETARNNQFVIYIKETKAPNGYLLDETVKAVDLSKLEYQVQEDASHWDQASLGTFVDEQRQIEVALTKYALDRDRETDLPVEGAVYGVYADADCRTLLAAFPATDANGCAKVIINEQCDRLYVKELYAAEGFILSDMIYEAEVTDGKASLQVGDRVQKLNIEIEKRGEILTDAVLEGEQVRFIYEETALPNAAAFAVYAKEDIRDLSGELIYAAGARVTTVDTDANGRAAVEGLPLGVYEVREISALPGYVLNAEPRTVTGIPDTKGSDVTCELVFYNERQKAEVSAYKYDSVTENPLSGGEYTLYADQDIKNAEGRVILKAGSALETVCTDANGRALYTVDLPIGYSYHIAETCAPYGYQRETSNQYSFTFTYEEQAAVTEFSCDFFNDRTTAAIRLQKLDRDSGTNVPGGDASLAGAVYGVYAGEDIVHPDGVTGRLYQAGELVTTMKTDENGYAQVRNLYLGAYYVAEITPSEGYLPDTDEQGLPTQYDLICSYEGDLTPEVVQNVTSVEQIIRQPFQLIKITVEEGETEGPAVEGAGFCAYLLSALPVLEDGSYDFEHAEAVVLCRDGSSILYTDEQGVAQSVPLPYGTYLVRETVVPENYRQIEPFVVRITENHPQEPQSWRVFIDESFAAKLRIVKLDAETKKPVLLAGSGFRIYNVDRQEYISQFTTYPSKEEHTVFYTDERGELTLPESLPSGQYRIEEAEAPAGYVLNRTPVSVTIESGAVYQVDQDTKDAVITVYYEDAAVTGELQVTKRGETLDYFSYSPATEQTGEYAQFFYAENGLPGAEFAVYAAEDIGTPDMQCGADGGRNLIYREGDLIGKITTDEDGTGSLTGLPLGTYRIVETSAPEGFVLNEESVLVTISYVDDATPVVYADCTILDERQRVELGILKTDAAAGQPVKGAVFGLYAAEDICNGKGELLVPAGGYIVSAVSGEDGNVDFACDLPIAFYTARELEAPQGYLLSSQELFFPVTYQGQEKESAVYKEEFVNSRETYEKQEENQPDQPLTVTEKEEEITQAWSNPRTDDNGEDGYSVLLGGSRDDGGRGKWFLLYAAAGLLLFAAILLLCFLVMSALTGAGRGEILQNTASDIVTPYNQPSSDEPSQDGEETEDQQLLQRYQEYNEDVVALIRIRGTVLEHPVVQTPEDETYYLRRDLDGKENSHGVPFLSAESSLSARGGNMVIYGHNIHKTDRDVFCDLAYYAEPDFYKEHPVIELTTRQGTEEWLIFAYYLVDTGEPEAFRYSDVTTFADESVYDTYMAEVSKRNWLKVDVNCRYGDSFLTLSSCSLELEGSGTNRMVVMAKLLEEGEDYADIVARAAGNDHPLLPQRIQ